MASERKGIRMNSKSFPQSDDTESRKGADADDSPTPIENSVSGGSGVGNSQGSGNTSSSSSSPSTPANDRPRKRPISREATARWHAAVDSALAMAAREKFGEHAQMISAHLSMHGVDVEDDLRYVDVDELLSRAKKAGLKTVHIAKLDDWVRGATQVGDDLGDRFANALRNILKDDGCMTQSELQLWCHEASTKLVKDYLAIKEKKSKEADKAQAACQGGESGGGSKKMDMQSLVNHAVGADKVSTQKQLLLNASVDEGVLGDYVQAHRQEEPDCLMFNPTTLRRLMWDFLVIMPLLGYLSVVMPFRLLLSNEARGAWFYLEMSMDFIFILDIFINFCTGYVDGDTGLVVYDRVKVARNYLRTWFPLDAVSGIPFGLLELDAFRSLSFIKVIKSSRILKALKLLRFLKLSRLVTGLGILNRVDPVVVDHIEDFLAEGSTRTALRILRILLIMGYMCHLMACAWVAAGRSADLGGSDSWLRQDLRPYEAEDTEKGNQAMRVYLAAFYFSLTTMTTVGYGDVRAYSNEERVVAMVLILTGVFMYAYIVSSLTSIVTIEDANAKHTRERLDAVASYIVRMELPADLGRRVRRYFRMRKSEAMDEGTILMNLSPALRSEVSHFLVEGGMLVDVALFRHMPPAYWPKVLPLLRSCPLMRGEAVCGEGESCLESFIVVNGVLQGTTALFGADPATTAPAKKKKSAAGGALLPPPSSSSPPGAPPLAVVPEPFSASPPRSGPAAAAAAATTRSSSARGSEKNELLRSRNNSWTSSGPPSSKSSSSSPQPSDQRAAAEAETAPSRSSSSAKKRTAKGEAQEEEEAAEEAPTPHRHMSLTQSMQGMPARVREIHPGGMVNALCVLKVWERSVESVVALESTEAYAITSNSFYAAFKDDEHLFKSMQEFVVFTQFFMDEDVASSEAPTKFGVPLYVLEDDEVEDRALEWEAEMKVRKNKANQRRKQQAAKKPPPPSAGRRPTTTPPAPNSALFSFNQPAGAPLKKGPSAVSESNADASPTQLQSERTALI